MAANVRSSPPPAENPPPEPANDASDGSGSRPSPLTAFQHELVQIGLPLVIHCSAEIARRCRALVTPAELLGPGTIGLHEAARSYDPEQHPSFPHFARHRVRGAMLDSIHAEHFSLRGRVEHAMERAYSRVSMHQVLDVDRFGASEEQLLEAAREGCDDALAAAFIAAVTESQEGSAEDAMILSLSLRDALSRLLPHEQKILHLVDAEGLSIKAASAALGVHANTGQRRYTRAIGKLRAWLLGEDPPRRR